MSENCIAYLPVLGLLDALTVCLSKLAFTAARINSGCKLCHWVEIVREVLQHRHNMWWEVSTVRPFLLAKNRTPFMADDVNSAHINPFPVIWSMLQDICFPQFSIKILPRYKKKCRSRGKTEEREKVLTLLLNCSSNKRSTCIATMPRNTYEAV